MARLILDTGPLIAAHRSGRPLAGDGDDVAVPTIVLTEFRIGALLDPDPDRSRRSLEFLRLVGMSVVLLDHDEDVVAHHAELYVNARRSGRPRGAHDLIIAATARATRRTLVTTDRRAGFEGLPGVDVRYVDV